MYEVQEEFTYGCMLEVARARAAERVCCSSAAVHALWAEAGRGCQHLHGEPKLLPRRGLRLLLRLLMPPAVAVRPPRAA